MEKTTVSQFDIIGSFLNFAELGAAWVMWLMIGLAFVLCVLLLERACLYWRTLVDAPKIGRALVEHLGRGDVDRAQRLVARGLAMEERVISDGLGAWSKGPRAVKLIMRSSLERERQRYECRLGFMGTVGSNAPFIGLLGTVIGIVLSFQALAANPEGGMAVVGPGIAESLVSTAVGLLVAIPAVVAFNSFKGSANKRLGNTEFLSAIVLSHLLDEVQ